MKELPMWADALCTLKPRRGKAGDVYYRLYKEEGWMWDDIGELFDSTGDGIRNAAHDAAKTNEWPWPPRPGGRWYYDGGKAHNHKQWTK